MILKYKQNFNITILTIGTFIVVLFFALIFNIITPSKSFSKLENRVLQQFPTWNSNDFFSGKWSSDLETYLNDQFIFRDQFVALKSATEQALGKTENNEVYISTYDTLIPKFECKDTMIIEQNINAINQFSANENLSSIPIYTTLIPTQSDTYDYKLPLYAPNTSQKEMINTIGNKLPNFISIYDTLYEHNQEYIYYNTDHHWTSLGAFYAYTEILPFICKDNPRKLNTYSPTAISNNFTGSLYAKSGVRNVTPDTIHLYTENLPTIEPSGLLYDVSAMNISDQYNVFQGGNHPLVSIKGNGTTDENLLLIKDSYGNSFLPFLTPHFDNIHMIDLRYNKSSISDFIVQHKITKVLFCYSITNFTTDNNLIFLK